MLPVCRSVAAAVLALGVATSASAQSSEAGRVRVVSGTAVIVRQGAEMPARTGQPILEGDHLKTGKDGRLGVTLKDDTRLSLGPDSEASVDRFLYSPADAGVALALSVLRGVAAYISGHIAKMAPDAVRISTPSAVLGVRGTHVVIRVQ